MKNMMKRILSLVWAFCLLVSNFGDMVRPVFGSDWAALETELTASDGRTYSITVYFDEETGVPEDTELQVTELREGSALYDAYVDQSTELLESEEEYLNLAKAFDITLRNTVTGEEYQPESSVRVSIRLMDVESLEDLGDVNVVHFGDKAPEVLGSEVEGDEVSFETESFSVYVVTAGQSTLRTYYFYTYDSFGNYAAYTFFDDHGNYVTSQTIKNGETLIAPHYVTDPSNPNAEFMGWYVGDAGPVLTDDNGDPVAPFNFDQPQSIEAYSGPTEEVHLYAVFSGYLYANFHGQFDNLTQTFPVLQTVRVKMTAAGTAAVDLDQYTASWYNTEAEGDSSFPRYTFCGWSLKSFQHPGKEYFSNEDRVENPDAETGYEITANTDFYPLYQEVRWLSFSSGSSGTGATYYSPIPVAVGETLVESEFLAHVPTRQGYDFQGWYLYVENLGTNQQNGAVTQLTYADGRLKEVTDADKGIQSENPGVGESYVYLSKDLTIYAKWQAHDVSYSVVTWKQRSDGSGYDWAETFELQALPDAPASAGSDYKALNNNASYNSVHTDSPLGAGDPNPYAGYTYNAAASDNGSKTVAYEGTTVFNLYYDRTPTTTGYTVLIWKQRSDGENYDWAESFTVSGVDSFTSAAAPDTYKTLAYPGYAYAAGKSDDGEKLIAEGGTTVFNLYYDYVTAPAAPGDGTFTLYFYLPGETDPAQYPPCEVGGQLLQDSIPSPATANPGYAFYWFADPGLTARVFFDQAEYDAFRGTKVLYTVMPDHDQSFYGGWVKEYALSFSYDSGSLAAPACAAGDALASVELPDTPAAPADKTDGYEFHWYADPGGAARVFFDQSAYDRYSDGPKVLYTVMPDHDLTVYGGWEKEWYLIQIDPNGGEMAYKIVYYDAEGHQVPEAEGVTRKHEGDTNATYFWKTYKSDYVQEYTWITRNYTESESGTWFYANHSYANQGPDRLTYYTDDITEATGLTTYKYAPGAYVTDGWYKVDPNTGAETLYSFGDPITGNLYLKLHWKLSDTFYLQFNGNVTQDGKKLNGTVSSVNAVVPSEDGYADQARIMLNCSAEAPEGYTFVGWSVRGDGSGRIYYPGSDFVLPGEYAVMMNGKRTVFLDAVYVRIRTAEIVYNANGGTVVKGADAGCPVDKYGDPVPVSSGTYFSVCDTDAGTVALEALVNNSPVKLADGSGFAAPEGVSWTLVGWNTEKDGSGTSFKLGADRDDDNHRYYVQVDDSVTLYAQWQVTVYFDKNDSAAEFGDSSVWAGFDSVDENRYAATAYVNALLPEPGISAVTKTVGSDVYVLDYWSTQQTSTGEEDAFDFAHTRLTDGMTLYAHYTLAALVPFRVVSWNNVLWEDWKDTQYLRVSTAGIDLTAASSTANYVQAADGYSYGYACLSADENGISEDNACKVTSIRKNSEGAVEATMGDGSVKVLDGDGRDADGRQLCLVYKNTRMDNRVKLAYVQAVSGGGLTPVIGKNGKITYNEGEFSVLNGGLVSGGVLSDAVVASGAVSGDTVTGQVLALGAEPLEISQRSASGVFNVPPLLDNKADLEGEEHERLTLVYDNAALGSGGADNVSGVRETAKKQFLRYFDGQRQWSADGVKWTTLPADVDTLYVIYRERGNELHITAAITGENTGISPDMSFTVTITSTAIIRSSYNAEGTGYSTVDAVPASGDAPGRIVLRVKEGSEIRIIGLGNGAYTLTTEYNPNYELEVLADGSETPVTTTPVTGGSSLGFSLNRNEKNIELKYKPSQICRVQNPSGYIYFYTLNSALEYTKTDLNGLATFHMLQSYVVPDWDALEIPVGYDITITSYKQGDNNAAFTLTRDKEFNDGPVIDNYGALTLGRVVLDGEGREEESPMLQTHAELTVNSGAVLKNANRTGSGGMIEQESGTLTVKGGTFQNNYATENGGAIYIKNGLVFLSGGAFEGNGSRTEEIAGETVVRKTEKGGALYYAGNSSIEISGGTFQGNFAAIGGGAIYAEGGAITVSGGSFTGNGKLTEELGGETVVTKTPKGGAIYMEVAALTLTKGTFTANAAGEDGGAIYAEAGEIELGGSSKSFSTLTENTAGGNGGAICMAAGTIDISFGGLTKNAAGGSGGAVYLESGTYTMTGGLLGGTNSGNGNTAANGSGVYIQSGAGYFSGGEVSYNAGSGGGAVSVGDEKVRLYFSGTMKIRNNTLGTGDDAPKCNVYLDRDSTDVLNFTGLKSGAEVGIFIADSLTDTRGIPGAKFASYTDNGDSGKYVKNDRDAFTVVSEASTKKFYWGKSIKVVVWYQSAAFSTAGYPPYADKAAGTLSKKKTIDTYYPVMGTGETVISLSALAADLYKNQSLGFAANTTAAFAGAYAAYKSGTEDHFEDYATKLKWDKTGKKWVLVGHDGSTETDLGSTLIVYYAEPAYISIENNTDRNMTVTGLTVGRDLINTDTYAGYGMVFAKNGFIRSDLLPIEASDLALPAKTSVTLLIPGARNTAYTLTASFAGGDAKNYAFKTSAMTDDGTVSVAADGTVTFPDGNSSLTGTTLNGAGTYKIVFGGEKAICQVGTKTFASISAAIADIVDNAATNGKTGTIEMLVDYLIPQSDPVNIPAGFDITLTTAEGYTNPDDPHEHRATLSRDSENPNSMLQCSAGQKQGTIFTVKNLIIDGKSVQGKSDGGAISTVQCRLIVDNVVFKNIYAQNGGAIFATDYVGTANDTNNTAGNNIQGELENTTKTYSYVKVTNSVFYDCKCNKMNTGSSNRNGGGAIHAYVDQLVVENCSFEKCTAITQAGAVFHRVDNNKCYSIAEIYGCSFTNCESQAAGGLELDSRWIVVKDCQFEHCVATARNGGGFNVWALNSGSPSAECYTIVQGCSFNDCHVTGTGDTNGGGFRSTSKYTQIIDSTFNNTSAKYGGAIGLSSTNAEKAEIYGCTINDGRASETGGGIRSTTKILIVDDAYSYTSDAGAEVLVFKSGDKYCSMGGTEVDPRYTVYKEGDKYYYSFVNAEGSTVKVEVRESEGKYYTIRDAEVETAAYTVGIVGHSSITYCRGKQGGSLYQERNHNDASLTVTNATISHNQSTSGAGGGIGARYVRNISITGSTISNNTAKGNGGGVWVGESSSKKVIIDSSSITGNSCTGIGGGVYANVDLTLRNGTQITGNQITTNPADTSTNAAGVYMADNKKLTVGINEADFKAAYRKANPDATDAQVNEAWAAWTDDTTVTGNTTSTTAPSNVRLWWVSSTQNNNAASVSVLCSLSGKIGVTNPGNPTTQFGTGASSSLGGFTEGQHVFEGDSGDVYGVFDRANATKLIWRGGVVCKLTDAYGRLLYLDPECSDPAVFDMLDNATDGSKLSPFSYLRQKSPVLYREKNLAVNLAEEGVCVKLLVSSYTLEAPITTYSSENSITTPLITLTTAGNTDADYPYRGRAGTYATIKRGYGYYEGGGEGETGGSLITTGANLTLRGITLDGSSADRTLKYYATDNGGLVKAEKPGITVTVGQNATLQNSRINAEGKNGGGLYIANGASLYIQGGILYNCAAVTETTEGYVGGNGGGVYINTTGKFEFTQGNISRCAAKNGGGIYVADVNNGETDPAKRGFLMSTGGARLMDCSATEKGGGVYLSAGKTMRMDGGFITDNSARDGGGGIYPEYSGYLADTSANDTDADKTRLIFSGRVTITDNTCKASETAEPYDCNVELGQNSNVVIQTTGLSRNSSIGVYVPGEDSEASQYGKHGMENKPFGHYEGDTTYLYCFVNDRNGLKGGLKLNLPAAEEALHNIYWVKVFSLEVKKTVISGRESDLEGSFTFEVIFSKTEGGEKNEDFDFAFVINRISVVGGETVTTAEDMEVKKGFVTFQLKNGESASFDNMPLEYSGFPVYYRVTEKLTTQQKKDFNPTTYRSTGSGGKDASGNPYVTGRIGEGTAEGKYASEAYVDNINAICKITSSQNGGVLLYTFDEDTGGFVPAIYSTLYNNSSANPGAFEVLNNDTPLYYKNEFSGQYYAYDTTAGHTLRVEMLVDNYRISKQVPVNKAVTLTTASPTAKDGFPYVGAAGTAATLIRKNTFSNALFKINAAGSLTLTGITLDGRSQKDNGTVEELQITGDKKGGLVQIENNAALNISSGAVLQYSAYNGNYGGAAVYISPKGTVDMDGGTVRYNSCTGAQNGAAFYVAADAGQKKGGVLNVYGDACIESNSCASGSGAGIYVQAVNGYAGTVNIYGNAKIQNNSCGTGSGAGVYAAAEGNTGATVTVSGSAAIQNNSCTSGNGAGIYAAANNAGGFATVTVSGSAAIRNNTCTSGSGAGICLAAGTGDTAGAAKLYLSGTPTFSGNTVERAALAGLQNGPDVAYTSGKARQDIYLAEKHEGAPASVIVNGALAGTDSNPENDRGSIWVWAENEEHYLMQKPFASIDGVDQADVNVELFRNAQPNSLTKCGTEDFLTGQFKVATDNKIYWTGGVDIRFIKMDGDGDALKDAQFRLVEKTVYDSDGLTGVYVGEATSADDGTVLFECVNYGIYILKETVVPSGYEESGPFIVVVGSENLNAAKTDTGVFEYITEDDINELTQNGEQFAIFLYDVSGGKAQPILNGAGDYINPNIALNGLLNFKEALRKVILKKTDNTYDPLKDAKFDLYRADRVLVKDADGNYAKDLTTDDSGVIWIGELHYGTYYLHEKVVPSGYSTLQDEDSSWPYKDNWFKFKVDETGVSKPVRMSLSEVKAYLKLS